jgi:hypothetical protein
MLLTAAPVTLRQAIDLLSAADSNTIWGDFIQRALETPTYEKVDDLLKSLQEQSRDNPNGIRRILGPYVYEKLGLQA